MDKMLRREMWKQFQLDALPDRLAEAFIDSHKDLPHKGCSCLLVGKGQVDRAEELLQQWDGVEWEYYYPDGWIRDTDTNEDFYNGKFEIENLQGFIGKLIVEGVTIVDLYIGTDYERGE